MAEVVVMNWVSREANYFSHGGWTRTRTTQVILPVEQMLWATEQREQYPVEDEVNL